MIRAFLSYIHSKGAVNYGRSKTRLKLALFTLLSPAALASDTAESIRLQEFRFVAPALAAIFVAILAHIVVPTYNKYRETKKARLAYLAYITSSLKSALKDFDDEISVSMATKLMDIKPVWLETLESANLGVPKVFLDTHDAFDKFKNQNHKHPDKYIPLFNYEGFFTGDVDHEHPLWELPNKEAELISDYLLSQAQISNSASRLYSEQYIRLANSSCPERIQQWVNASTRTLNELALHYINIKMLTQRLPVVQGK